MITTEQVKEALDLLDTGADRMYFFQKLSSSDWLPGLIENAVFNDPPSPIEEEGNIVIYPSWPDLEFVLRIVTEEKNDNLDEIVHRILKSIPSSDNLRIRELMVDIACNISVDRAEDWIREQLEKEECLGFRSFRFDPLVKLATNLANGGYGETVIALFNEILALDPDPRNESDIPFGLPQEQTRIDHWTYESILKETVPQLADRIGFERCLRDLLCPLMQKAIAYSTREVDSVQDYSVIWKPRVDSDDHLSSQPRKVLVSSIRNVLRLAAESNDDFILPLIEILDSQEPQRLVFTRLTLNFIREFEPPDPSILSAKLLDAGGLHHEGLWPEYALLLRDRFHKLTDAQQEEIISIILSGPILDDKESGAEDELTATRSEFWILRRLTLIKGHLNAGAQKVFAQLEDKHGPLEDVEESFRRGSSLSGPTSPISTEDIRELGPSGLINYLKTWRPEMDPHSPSPEGLSRIISATVGENPALFADSATDFQGLDPTYVRGLIVGFEQTENVFSWDAILSVCRWVVEQPRDGDMDRIPVSDKFDIDPDWGWTRKRIASLIRTGLWPDEKQIPFEYRTRVWNLIESLLSDPEPTAKYELDYGGSNMDPLTMSINTVRGEAMHAAISYTLWIWRNTLSAEERKSVTAGYFDYSPEVVEVFARHLDTNHEPALTIRAVYGRWFTQLHRIASDWAVENVDLIFPTADQDSKYFYAAWDAYLFSSDVYSDIYRLLEKQYQIAVQNLVENHKDGQRSESQLADHLMALMTWGRIDSTDDSILGHFFSNAGPRFRQSAILSVGRAYSQVERSQTDDDLVNRLIKFWVWRLRKADEAGGTEEFKEEVRGFGSWVTLNLFEDEWLLNQFRDTTRLCGNLSNEQEALQKLLALSALNARTAIESLEHMVKGAHRYSFVHTGDSTREILTQVLKSQDEPAARGARRLIDYFVSQGRFEFRHLLETGE